MKTRWLVVAAAARVAILRALIPDDVDLTLARRWHTTHLASPLRCPRLWLEAGDWTGQTWAACALAPGHDGPCKHIDPLGRLAPIPPDHVEVP